MIGIAPYGQNEYGVGKPFNVISEVSTTVLNLGHSHIKTIHQFFTTILNFKSDQLTFKHVFQTVLNRASNILSRGGRRSNSVTPGFRNNDPYED